MLWRGYRPHMQSLPRGAQLLVLKTWLWSASCRMMYLSVQYWTSEFLHHLHLNLNYEHAAYSYHILVLLRPFALSLKLAFFSDLRNVFSLIFTCRIQFIRTKAFVMSVIPWKCLALGTPRISLITLHPYEILHSLPTLPKLFKFRSTVDRKRTHLS